MRVCERCRSLYQPGAKFCSLDGQALVDANGDPLLGQQLGRYKITELLGRGGCGSVYKASHAELGTDFAIKVLYGHLAAEGNYVERFRREAQAVSRIRSPWVASVIDFATSEAGLTYLVMEFCTGQTLDSLLRQDKAFTPQRAARLVAQIASGLSVAHKLGFVHRDIKPANIVVDRQNGAEFAKVLDFGIVQVADPAVSGKLTREGVIMGTPAYMSPEQATAKEATAKSDLYSLGVVLYHMLAGRKPFKGGVTELMEQQVNARPEPLTAGGPLANLAYALLEKDPERRPPSAQIVAETAKRIEIDLRGGEMSLDPADLDHTPEPAPMTPPPQPRAPQVTLQLQQPPAPPPLADPTQAAMPLSTDPLASGARFHPPPAAKNRVLPLVLLGVGAAAIVSGGLWFAQRPEPKVEIRVDHAARVTDLEIELGRVLALRGIEAAELSGLPETKDAYTQSESSKGGDPEVRERALAALLEATRKASLSPDLLTARLDKLDGTLAQAGQRLPPAEFEALKERYLELYRRINHAEAGPELEKVSQDTLQFVAELKKAAGG
ncbi:MAG: serine/threonine-protein kinase [Myxococcota bacterium]